MEIDTGCVESESIKVKKSLTSNLSLAMRWALLWCFVVAFAFGSTGFILNFRYYGFLPALVSALIFLVVILVVSTLLTLLFIAFKRLRWQTYFVIVASILLIITALAMLVYLIPLLIFSMTAVYLAVMCVTGQYKTLRRFKKILRFCLLGLFSVLTIVTLVLTFWTGPTLKPNDRPEYARLALPYFDKLRYEIDSNLTDPSIPGCYTYQIFCYATPGQKIEPYLDFEAIPAPTVDASELLEGWSGVRSMMLGFKPNSIPLTAQVWMHDGAGPFPLALIIHGNHESADRSDRGYEYLGELLASRGIIAISVDENFLNISALYDFLMISGLKNENGARAYILLEHLSLLYDWNTDSSNPFYSKIDFDNIALIGHSRGGEAVALAAAFAELKYYPDNGRVSLDYPFRIKTVVAIAPVHRQYDPAGLEVSLSNINYLVLHGAHDMDVSSFMGANMYRRADVSDYGVKAQVWMQYANHGQFNSSWGNKDLPGIMNMMSKWKLLMPEEEQQQAAKVFISAFLESTLNGKDEYNSLFRDFAYGAEWLPAAQYITDYADCKSSLLDGYDKGFDLAISSLGKVEYRALGFDVWTQTVLPGKMDNSNRVLLLQWGSEEYAEKYGVQTPVFFMEFANNVISVGDKLYISLCSGKESANEPDISFQIKLTDSLGQSVTLSVDDFGGIVDPIDAPIYKPLFINAIGKSEPVLQVVCIPTECFKGLIGDIVSMEWIMETAGVSKKGQTLYIDDLRVEKRKGH